MTLEELTRHAVEAEKDNRILLTVNAMEVACREAVGQTLVKHGWTGATFRAAILELASEPGTPTDLRVGLIQSLTLVGE